MTITYEKREERFAQHTFEIPDDAVEVFLSGRTYNGEVFYGLYDVDAGGQSEVVIGREHIKVDYAPQIRIRISSCKRFLQDYKDVRIITKERFLSELDRFNSRTRPKGG